MTPKYDTVIDQTVGMYRIRALRSFGEVLTGELGGLIQNLSNLSQEGECWVFPNASVLNYAVVEGNAKIRDNALVGGRAKITENSVIMNNATVLGNTIIFGNTIISGSAYISINGVINDGIIITNNVENVDSNTVQSNTIFKEKLEVYKSILHSSFGHTLETNAKTSEIYFKLYNKGLLTIEDISEVFVYLDSNTKLLFLEIINNELDI